MFIAMSLYFLWTSSVVKAHCFLARSMVLLRPIQATMYETNHGRVTAHAKLHSDPLFKHC